MKFTMPLERGKIINRYKRFLADIKLENHEVITAYIANTGSMKTCWAKDWPALLSFHDNPKRKLKYSLEMLYNGKTWIGVNTSRPNHIVEEAIRNKEIKELQDYSHIQREFKVGKSRLDFKLESEGLPDFFLEVKNVTLKGENEQVLFPDAVTKRGQKHLEELISLCEQGYKTGIFFLVQREDVKSFSPASKIDPLYAELLKKAEEAGVLILVYQCKLSPEEISIEKSLPYEL